MRSVRGRVATYVIARDRARENRLTAVVLINGEIFQPFGEYLAERSLSLSRERAYAQAIVRLIEFMAARAADFAEERNRHQLFTSFSHALHRGTLGAGEEDPHGLYWLPCSSDTVESLTVAACEFSDWLVDKYKTRPLNPYRQASHAERIAFWRSWNKMRSAALLAHTKDRAVAEANASVARRFALPSRAPAVAGRPKFFPHERFGDLIGSGFINPGKSKSTIPWVKYNIRDQMICILMYGASVRVSEACHMFVGDVYEDPFDKTMSHVRMYHPSEGEIEWIDPRTGKYISTNRATFLKVMYDRSPLHWDDKSGWKGMLLKRHGKFRPLLWLPAEYGRLFLQLYRLYVRYVRPANVNHPWLFVTKEGEPMNPEAIRRSMAAACRRIGLRSREADGTTPHGLRHGYGQRMQDLVDAGLIDKKIFQVGMGQTSILSQEVYNDREAHLVQRRLAEVGAAIPVASIP
ncbi:gamma-mobile-trio recombinase GmtY [Sphingosinicella humi]|uniref:Integrase n=1 Tax=Allosphingosinicella humi TaxID=2068657 RepID=A0A2U2J047_9SPHN|nr:gamma-mobile-trio recombinase GmtY [Sphingosinicella humi]PWG01705.1 integrase [Sphingosinicella humi]